MSLAFLYPLAWLGALALGVPIWLHLRRRHETSLVRFSALQFLDDQPLARKRPLWPRDWPLLLLRLLALLLLVAAFTWPYLASGVEEVAIEESCVYLLDNTLSNQAEGTFQKARDELVREVSAAGGERQIAVVELAAQPRVLAGFGDDRAEAVDRLRALKPSFQRGSYLAAFRAADSLLRDSLGARKRIVLLGDSQENQWAEAGQVLPFLEDVEIVLPKVAQPSRPNVALAQLGVQRFFLDDRVIAECTVRLYHHGDQQAATVVYRAGGREVARREVKLAGQPESISVSARWDTDPAHWLQGEALLDGQQDVLPADDRVVFALAPVREGRVALLARSPFLQAALSPEVMKGRWATRVLPGSDFGEDQGGGFRVPGSGFRKEGRPPDSLAPGPPTLNPEPRTLNPEEEVLCLESHFLQAAAARSLLRQYLDAGKGVVLVVDQAGPTVAGVLREMGIEVASEAGRGFRVQGSGFRKEGGAPDSLAPDPRTLNPEPFRYVSTDHPVFQPFRSADFGNLSEIEVWRHRRLAPAQNGRSAGAVTPLVFSADGDPLVIEWAGAKGKMFILAFSMDRSETNWPIHPTFIPFLDRCLDQARPSTGARTALEPGESTVWQVPPGSRASEVALKKLGEEGRGARDENLRPHPSSATPVANGQARLTIPDVPGLYTVHYDGGAEVESVLAVNPPPDESRLTYSASPEAIKGWVRRGKGLGIRDWGLEGGEQTQQSPTDDLIPNPQSLIPNPEPPNPDPLLKPEILQQRIWWWLALAGLAALVLESTWLSLRKGWA